MYTAYEITFNKLNLFTVRFECLACKKTKHRNYKQVYRHSEPLRGAISDIYKRMTQFLVSVPK